MQENISVPGEVYTSVRATPELVGREDVLLQVDKAIRDTSCSHIIYITGQGGIGKTRVLKHILKNLPKDVQVIATSELIDLYHTRVHSISGLISSVLESTGLIDEFENFIGRLDEEKTGGDKLKSTTRAEQEGLSRLELLGRQERLTHSFIEFIQRCAQQKRLVLAFDTTERLINESDPVQELLGLSEEQPAIVDWLFKYFFPRICNAVILLAGRPGSNNLGKRLSDLCEKNANQQRCMFTPIDLQGLTEAEALDYFEAVIDVAESSEKKEDREVANNIRMWSEEQRRAIFYCLCDTGSPLTIRPILLALAIDYLTVEGQPLPALKRSLKEAQSLEIVQREEICDQLGRALVEKLQEHCRPADEVITALGWLRKGATAELLSCVTELSRKDIGDSLGSIQDLSFIKIRPADERIFLHDEMYDLLRRYITDKVSDPARKRLFNALKDYYEEVIKRARNEIADLYAPLTYEAALPESEKVAAARARLQDALVEDLHYQLRSDPVLGFQTYFCYAEEAIVAHDESLDMQLRAELLSFLSERDPSGQLDAIDGLRRSDILADVALRWIKRLIGGGRYKDAVEVARRLRSEANHLIKAGGIAAEAELDSWEAFAWVYQGDVSKAEGLLTSLNIETFIDQKPDSLRKVSILARIYNNRGYIHRVMGYYYGAIKDYGKALPRWGRTGIEVEIANTENNLAFAKAEVGWSGSAERLAQGALERREKLGPRSPVGLSLNTLAHIAIRDNRFGPAVDYARKAYALFSSPELGDERGKGLALVVLAEALRRSGGSSGNRELLDEAVEKAQQGVAIFRKLDAADRQVEALIELGCAYRDLAKIVRGPYPEASKAIPEEAKELAEEGEKAFQDAAETAGKEKIIHYQVNALINLAWLYYYLLRNQDAGKHVKKARESLIPALYYITPISAGLDESYIGGLPKLEEDKTVVPFLMQLGKAQLLEGQIAFSRFESDKNEDDLRKAIEHYTLSLAYDTLFYDQSFRDMRRAMDSIYYRLRSLDPVHLALVPAMVDDIEEKYGLGNSRLNRFLRESFGELENLK